MKLEQTGPPSRRASLAGLLLLCLLWSLGPLRSDLLANLVPNVQALERGAISLALLAVVAAVLVTARRGTWPRGMQVGNSVLIGLGLFVVPAVVVLLTRQWVPGMTRVVLFSLVPVFAVVFEPHIGGGAGQQGRGALAAAMAAMVGMLLVFPMETPSSIAAGFAFCALVLAAACIAAVNCRAVVVASSLHGESTAPVAAIAGATGALVLGAASAGTEAFVWRWDLLKLDLAWSVAVDLPALFLLFWLMRTMSAVRMTTRFVLAPLIAALIGMALLRPAVGLRAGVGLLLVALGTGWLLFAPEEAADRNDSLLNLSGE